MAHFIGYVTGKSKTMASRLGGSSSGITVSANGWNFGVDVRGYVDENGDDHFFVYLTGGSNGGGRSRRIGDFTEKDLKE
jgi:hypothetical protein